MNQAQKTVDLAMQANPTIPDEARKQLEEEEYLKSLDWTKEYKRLWARAYSLNNDDKEKTYKYMEKLCKLVGGWSITNMDIRQIVQAYRLTNSIQK